MKRFYEKITKHQRLIIVLFLVTTVVCTFAKTLISVNYDMTDYLPEDSLSTVALDTMNEEFNQGIPNARVMLKDVSIADALEYKSKIENVDGVSSVTWLDDSCDINEPVEFMDQDIVETYYKDGNALLTVTIDEDKRIEACNDIRTIIGDDNAMTGSAVSTATATTSTVTEIPRAAIFAVIFTLLVLFITTTSYVEPIVVMAGLGVAVMINAGTNLIFGEISFVTNAAGNILQLAVSLDYSVFLLHRFEEYKDDYDDPKEAMVNALVSSQSSILSSGLTTVIGFIALCLMQFRIGPDLGLALAKGIAISLITVFVFMPAFILKTYKWIDKTKHQSFLPSFKGFSKFVTKMMAPFSIIFAILIVPSYLASNKNDFYYGSSHIFNETTQYGKDTQAIEDVFGKSDNYVLMVPKTSTATQKELSDALHDMKEVQSIISYVDTVGETIPETYLDTDTLSKLNSENYTRMVLNVSVDYEGEETYTLIENIRNTAEKYYPGEWMLAGEGVSTLDLKDTVTADMIKVNLVAIGSVAIVLLLTMKSISLPILLVTSIETAIWIGLSIPYFTSSTLFYIAYLIISSIQLGATVDYAILLTERYLEYRQEYTKKAAIQKTIQAVTGSILTSSIVLTTVGFLLGFLSSHGLLVQLGMLLARGTICSLLIVLFVLPGLLYMFDKLIQKTSLNMKLKEEKE